MDGKECEDCGKAIDIRYKKNGAVDRSNRVDCDAGMYNKLTDQNPTILVTYHKDCWRRLIHAD